MAGHWRLSEEISKVATKNLDQLGLHCMYTDGQSQLFIDQLILHSALKYSLHRDTRKTVGFLSCVKWYDPNSLLIAYTQEVIRMADI